jgi:hypothetical protein
MARLLTAGAETLNAIGDDKTMEGGITTSGTVTVETGTIHSGSKSFKIDTGAGTPAYVQKTFTGVSATTYYARVWFNCSAAPSTGTAPVLQFLTAGGAIAGGGAATMSVQTTGKIGDSIGSNVSGVVADGQWHYAELALQILTAGNDYVESRVDGVSLNTFTGALDTVLPGMIRAGAMTSTASFVTYIDDLALNDSNAGSGSTSWPGLGRQVLLLPISDNAVGTGWTGGAGGASNLFEGVNNIAPQGAADPGTDASQIRNASNATANYDANLTTYATAGIAAADTVNLVQPWIITGAPTATGAKTGALQITSNPAEGAATAFQTTSNFFRASGVNAGTYPTGWAFSTNPITYAPSVTVGSSPVLRADITGGTATRIADVCFMGMYVDYTPAVVTQVPYTNPMPQLLAQ